VISMCKCSTIKCQHLVREGLRRYGTGVDGQELADGRFCWRCRARHGRDERRDDRRSQTTKKEGSS
jgi:hypothetical protein